MPYPNEHAARIRPPEKYDEFRRENDAFGDGIHAIYGISGGKSELQSIRFDADKFTAEQAKAWLEQHGYEPIIFEEATKEGTNNMQTIKLYGEIGYDVKAKDVAEAILKSDSDIELRIHSPGGDVSEGFVIVNAIDEATKRHIVRCVVDGMAGSIASVIACAGTELIMYENSFLVIHNPYAIMPAGDANTLRKNADDLDKIRSRIVSIYQRKINKTEEEIVAMMDAETFIFGDEYEQYGLMASLALEKVQAAALVGHIRFRSIPERAMSIYRCADDSPPQPNEEQELDELRQRLQALQAENDALRAENERLKEELAQQKESPDVVELTKRLEKITQEGRKHQANADRLAAEIQKLQAAHAEKLKMLEEELAESKRREMAATERLAQVSMQAFALDPEVDSWQDALRSCGGDPQSATIAPDVYLAFKRRYPHFFNMWAEAQLTKGRKR